MAKKRIILMYISEVSGHHSATLAIENAIRMLDVNVEVLNLNAFNYTNPVSEKIVNRLYLGVIKKTPKIWDYLYDNPVIKKKIDVIKNVVHRFNSPKLKILFDRFSPDVVACSQAFPCGMVADFKKTYNSNIPLVAILTDYAPHSYWIYKTVDFYVVPSEEVKIRLIKKGVTQERVKPFGIPFDPKFNRIIDRQATIKKLGLIENLPTVLIMGGGQGLGPIKTVINSLDETTSDFQEIIITGVNKELYKYLSRRLKRYKKKILLLKFVDNVDELMVISSLIITKPGGITTAEALTRGLPMLIVKPIPGQEENNTRYLTNKGAAIRVDDPRRIGTAVDGLWKNHGKLTHMSKCAKEMSRPHAALEIARFLLDL
jgi:processive 1,2-diacylglycerol beta-glucosyltransferase